MAIESESILEEKLIAKLVNQDYEYIKISNKKDLIANLKNQLEKLNKTHFTDAEFSHILSYIEKGSVFDKSKKLRSRLRLDSGKFVSFFNQKEWCNNIYQVSNQVRFNESSENNSAVTILINGFPLTHIELKRRGMELKKAFNQLERCHEHLYNSLFDFVQIFVISNGIDTKYYANNRKLNYKFTFYWKDKENNNITDLNRFTEIFLDKCHLSKMIARYIVLNEAEESLMVLRAYQYYAVEYIIDYALNTKNNGYIWHTTGSGKTLTSFKAAQILKNEESIDKVLFIIDRRDLDYQTTVEFNKFNQGSVDGTDNTKALVDQLNDKNSKLIITTMQKLDIAIKRYKNKLSSIKDDRLVLMFDECHRSQFGDMHKNITDYFTNIQYFGFTGTPIFVDNANNNRTTADIFGNKLHSYTIQNAINDENVLGFMVEYVGKYLNTANYDNIIESIDVKEILESEDRLNKIVDYIIKNHDKKTFNRDYTSIFAVSSIEVLNKYYEIFKSKEHDLKIAAIYSSNKSDDDCDDEFNPRIQLQNHIKDFNEMFDTNHKIDSFNQYYVDVSKKSKECKIDILLVVNMFLTGFDNKSLNTLYLDKNLKYHGLLQAFSRTNRIFGERKKHGNIISFRNIQNETDDSIKLFADSDASEIVLIEPYDVYVTKFNEISKMLLDLVPTVEEVDNLPSENEDKQFVEIYRELLRLMNRLTIFTEFNYGDLKLSEDVFEDYRDKYYDMYKKYVESPEKTSVLDDIDFEIELIRRDNINVAYILDLLKQLNYESNSFKKDREFIINTMRKTPELKSKVSLINEFIEENVVQNSNVNLELIFNEFMDDRKSKEISNLIKEENLKKEEIIEIIENYEFTGKIKNSSIKKSFNEKLGFLEKRKKMDKIKNMIINLVNKYSW